MLQFLDPVVREDREHAPVENQADPEPSCQENHRQGRALGDDILANLGADRLQRMPDSLRRLCVRKRLENGGHNLPSGRLRLSETVSFAKPQAAITPASTTVSLTTPSTASSRRRSIHRKNAQAARAIPSQR